MTDSTLVLIKEKIINTDSVIKLVSEKNLKINQLRDKLKLLYHKYLERNKEAEICKLEHGPMSVDYRNLLVKYKDLEESHNNFVNNSEIKYQRMCKEFNDKCDRCHENSDYIRRLEKRIISLKKEMKKLRVKEKKKKSFWVSESKLDIKALKQNCSTEIENLKSKHILDLEDVKTKHNLEISDYKNKLMSFEARETTLNEEIKQLNIQLDGLNESLKLQNEIKTDNVSKGNLFDLLSECAVSGVSNLMHKSVQTDNNNENIQCAKSIFDGDLDLSDCISFASDESEDFLGFDNSDMKINELENVTEEKIICSSPTIELSDSLGIDQTGFINLDENNHENYLEESSNVATHESQTPDENLNKFLIDNESSDNILLKMEDDKIDICECIREMTNYPELLSPFSNYDDDTLEVIPSSTPKPTNKDLLKEINVRRKMKMKRLALKRRKILVNSIKSVLFKSLMKHIRKLVRKSAPNQPKFNANKKTKKMSDKFRITRKRQMIRWAELRELWLSNTDSEQDTFKSRAKNRANLELEKEYVKNRDHDRKLCAYFQSITEFYNSLSGGESTKKNVECDTVEESYLSSQDSGFCRSDVENKREMDKKEDAEIKGGPKRTESDKLVQKVPSVKVPKRGRFKNLGLSRNKTKINRAVKKLEINHKDIKDNFSDHQKISIKENIEIIEPLGRTLSVKRKECDRNVEINESLADDDDLKVSKENERDELEFFKEDQSQNMNSSSCNSENITNKESDIKQCAKKSRLENEEEQNFILGEDGIETAKINKGQLVEKSHLLGSNGELKESEFKNNSNEIEKDEMKQKELLKKEANDIIKMENNHEILEYSNVSVKRKLRQAHCPKLNVQSQKEKNQLSRTMITRPKRKRECSTEKLHLDDKNSKKNNIEINEMKSVSPLVKGEQLRNNPQLNHTDIEMIKTKIKVDTTEKPEKIKFKRPNRRKIEIDSPMSPPTIQNLDDVEIEPAKIIPLEPVGELKRGRAKELVKKLIQFPNESLILQEVFEEFSNQKKDFIIGFILEEISLDDSTPDTLYTPPAPVMTVVQRTLLGLLAKLQEEFPNLLRDTLPATEEFILSQATLQNIQPLTRFYISLCKLRKDIHRMRRMMCDVFYYLGDLSIPFLFTVLSTWTDVLPLETESSGDPLVKVLIQIINMKTCSKPGYNLLPLKKLFEAYYGYPTERWQSEQVFKEVLEKFKEKPTKYIEYSLLILCKNHPDKWVCQQVTTYLKPSLSTEENDLYKSILSLTRNILKQLNGVNSPGVKKVMSWFEELPM